MPECFTKRKASLQPEVRLAVATCASHNMASTFPWQHLLHGYVGVFVEWSSQLPLKQCHLWLSSHIFHVMLFIDQSVVITCFCWLVFHFISVCSDRPLNYSLGPMWWIACLFVTLKVSQLWSFLIKLYMNNYSINSMRSLNYYFQCKSVAIQNKGHHRASLGLQIAALFAWHN